MNLVQYFYILIFIIGFANSDQLLAAKAILPLSEEVPTSNRLAIDGR